MSDDTGRRRATRRTLATRPIEQGAPTAGQKLRYTPLTDGELAQIITEARAQRAEEDITEYARRRAA